VDKELSDEIRSLVFTDIHLSPTREQLVVVDFVVEDVDAVFTLGDNRDHVNSVADGERYEALGPRSLVVLQRQSFADATGHIVPERSS